MAETVPVQELRSNLDSLLDDVSRRHDRVLVTRNGAPTAALVPIDGSAALEETAEVLSDPNAPSALEAGLAEIERDEKLYGTCPSRSCSGCRPSRSRVSRATICES